jgi:hypothetical protein
MASRGLRTCLALHAEQGRAHVLSSVVDPAGTHVTEGLAEQGHAHVLRLVVDPAGTYGLVKRTTPSFISK